MNRPSSVIVNFSYFRHSQNHSDGFRRSLLNVLTHFSFSDRFVINNEGHPDLLLANTFFLFLLCNFLTYFDKTWQEVISLNVLYEVCGFWYIRQNMTALASDWPTQFWPLICNHWTDLDETWQSLTSCTKVLFSGDPLQYGHPGFWFAYPFVTSPIQPLKLVKGFWFKKKSRKQVPNVL